MQNVRIVKYPGWTEDSIYEVVQFSRHDTISDLYSRLIDPDNSESQQLWVVIKLNDSCIFFINGIKEYDKQRKKFKINWKKVESSDNNMMSFGLNKDSILILITQEIKNEEWYTSLTNYDEDTEDLSIDDKLIKNKIVSKYSGGIIYNIKMIQKNHNKVINEQRSKKKLIKANKKENKHKKYPEILSHRELLNYDNYVRNYLL